MAFCKSRFFFYKRVANSQTQVTVTWYSPTAITAVNTFEISWTRNHGESQPKSLPNSSRGTIITGLQGETDYTITITSKDTTSGSTTISESVTVNVKTMVNLKVSSANAVAYSQTQVTVTWYSPNAITAVNTFEISWTPNHGEPQPKFLPNSSRGTIITGLQGETDYTITITSKDTTSGSTTISESVTVNVKTTSELKSKNVQVTVINTTSVTLTWTHPTATSYNVIEDKQVRITGTTNGSLPASGSKDVLVSATSTTVVGLTPGGSFFITVVSIDTNSRHIQQEVASDAVSVTTKPAVPGKIGSVVPDDTGYRVALSWIGSVGVVTSYRVVFEGGNGDTHTQSSSTNTITMTSLTPGRRYNITITAISGGMTSDPSFGNTRATVIAPDAPTNLKCNTVMDTNVTLVWTPPANPNGDIMYYSINVISGPGSPRTVNTTTPVQIQEIDNLKEDSYYSFTVRAKNDLYDGPVSFSHTCKTKPGSFVSTP
ncbi:hypothetical protein KUTeg_007879 [Tegillarca granosa]|uniref:Fibronectin type-III domain-containing protein n=1 Tax=Tegillarca granosa TaxID=220873 RepID=A0ABQ9FEH4_TEGGR|nr:hypothetical protein KUTeg_007879 [Tegillarca granosa]